MRTPVAVAVTAAIRMKPAATETSVQSLPGSGAGAGVTVGRRAAGGLARPARVVLGDRDGLRGGGAGEQREGEHGGDGETVDVSGDRHGCGRCRTPVYTRSHGA